MNKISVHGRLTSIDGDYALWIKEQADLMRAGRRDLLDLNNLAEEIESLGNSQRSEIESRLHVLLIYLLKWEFQPDGRSSGWKGTIREQRRRIGRLIKASPSLKSHPGEVLEEEYETARLQAAGETSLAEVAFPLKAPYSADQALDLDFWPGEQ